MKYFSETRFIEQGQDSGEEVSGLAPTSSQPPAHLLTVAKKTKSRPICNVCKKGFQFKRVPALQIECKSCKSFTHFRCISSVYDEDHYLCGRCNQRCASSTTVPAADIDELADESNQAVSNQEEVPANTECSLDELANTTVPMAENLAVSTFPECRFTERMRFLGFERSRTQPNTPGDGSCFIWAVLDSYNNNQNQDQVQ